MSTKLLPKHLHVLLASLLLGGTGGAIFPFAVGAAAQVKGVEVLQPIMLVSLALISLLWLLLPKARGPD